MNLYNSLEEHLKAEANKSPSPCPVAYGAGLQLSLPEGSGLRVSGLGLRASGLRSGLRV